MGSWDYLIVTASSPAQAEAFSIILHQKMMQGIIPSETQLIVIPDGKQSKGSAEAFLGVLQYLYTLEKYTYFPHNKRVLLIQSGGESRRIPQYSAIGKVFAPVTQLGFEDFFESILNSVHPICNAITGGILVSTGDICLRVPAQLKSITENTAFALKVPAERGPHHGVFSCDENGILQYFLHKKPLEVLQESDAVDLQQQVLLDTGLVFFMPECMDTFYSLSIQLQKEQTLQKHNFYGDFLFPFAQKSTLKEYLEQPTESGTPSTAFNWRKLVFSRLHEKRLRVFCLDAQPFVHIGTPGELLGLNSPENGIGSYNSVVEQGAEILPNTFIENSIVESSAKVGRRCILSNVIVSQVNIPDNTGIYCVPLTNHKYVAILYSTESVSSISDQKWKKRCWPVRDSRAEAVRATIEGQKGDESSFSALCETDYQALLKWNVYTKHRNKAMALEGQRKRILSETFEAESVVLKLDYVHEELPVRVNLGGTWTDAAPYCIMFGGAVLNAAITLNGQMPIQVNVFQNDLGRIVFRCTDFHAEKVITDTRQIYDLNDINDEFSLHKAALIVSGIVPPKWSPLWNPTDLGITLETCAKGVPQGSGLGTSSLLLSACIRSLYKITGRNIDKETITQKVFQAEQLMRTGGGWQDQAGGLYKGVKLLQSKPGHPQKIDVVPIHVMPAFLETLQKRIILIYTGEKHIGRYILTDIMHRVIQEDAHTIQALHSIKDLAIKQKDQIEQGDFSGFVQSLLAHKNLLNQLSEDIESQKIQNIQSVLNGYLDVLYPCGAGGGGFCFGIMKENCSTQIINQLLKNKFKKDVRTYEFKLQVEDI